MIRLIVAIDRDRGLAKHGVMPWYIPDDEKYFTDQTKTHGGITLTGHTTYKTFKGPLAERENYVLSREKLTLQGAHAVHDLAKFLEDFRDKDVWIVGGAAVFAEVMKAGKADELYITHIDANFGCDRFLPDYQTGFELSEQSQPREQNGFNFTYAVYRRADA
ncbi:MAG: dihydrofolate reductase [Candidatus Binatota bacterium]|nr:dihydrofolate reductase [Candidatus Binatota bacterium]